MILYLLVLFSYEIEKELSGEKLKERKRLRVLFVGFCGLCAFAFLSVGSFVCLFCFVLRREKDRRRRRQGFFVVCFVFGENGESIMASDGIYHLVSVHCIRACTGCHCQT